MSSNILSRLLPSLTGNPSIYDTIEQHERVMNAREIDRHEDGTLDELNLIERFQDQDLDQLLAEATGSQVTNDSSAFPATNPLHISPHRQVESRGRSIPRWMLDNQKRVIGDEDEDDVPESLLLEGERDTIDDEMREHLLPGAEQQLPRPVPGPANRHARFSNTSRSPLSFRNRRDPIDNIQARSKLFLASRAEKAMYMWTNVENLDTFLKDVYDYYMEKGMSSIILGRALELLASAFVGILVAFLSLCIDYTMIPKSKSLSQVTIPQCTKNLSAYTNIIIWLGVFYWIFKLFQYVLDLRRLRNLHDFYLYLLDIREDEMQTISWQTIVSRLMNLRDANPRTATDVSNHVRRFVGQQSKQKMDKQRMDAHDIANRLMRKDNYLIAMFNKEILDTTLVIPWLGPRELFSETIEWNINFCVMDLVFNEQGQVKQLFLKDTHRQELIDTLKARFLFAAFMNVLSIPILVPYMLCFFILRFFLVSLPDELFTRIHDLIPFQEFQRNPSKLGARAYTRLAEWKFREFNELWHLFERRRDMSYPFAARYIDQFPKHNTVQLAKFVAFVSGALATVLAIASLLGNELFLGFEITTDRTVIFYLGVLGTIWAVCRGVVPEENLVFDPEFAIQNVIDYTHHCPARWEGNLHSDQVRREFATLYPPKVATFANEILSVILTPFILWFKLSTCSERLVDFFREFTVHVDGLGYVCSFAVFEFEKGKPEAATRKSSSKAQGEGAPPGDPRDDYYSTKDGKMLVSYYNFLDSYAPGQPRWGGGPARYREPTRSQFHPPPTFPGLSQGSPLRDETGPSQSIYRQRGPTINNQASPSPSLLLDPHHQPSPSLVRRAQRHMGVSRLQQVEETDAISPLRRQQGVSQSTMIAEDSHLGESWKTTTGLDEGIASGTHTRADIIGDEVDEDEENDNYDTSGGQGVLGMLYEFQKAQSEGRGRPGVGI